MNKIYLLLLLAATFAVSCSQNDEIAPLTTSLAGEWEVVAYLDGTPVHEGTFPVIISGDFPARTDSVTIGDVSDCFWNFRVKVAADHENGTFQTRQSVCEHSSYPVGIRIFNGRVTASDSLFLDVSFEDDETPYGNVYQLRGSRTR